MLMGSLRAQTGAIGCIGLTLYLVVYLSPSYTHRPDTCRLNSVSLIGQRRSVLPTRDYLDTQTLMCVTLYTAGNGVSSATHIVAIGNPDHAGQWGCPEFGGEPGASLSHWS